MNITPLTIDHNAVCAAVDAIRAELPPESVWHAIVNDAYNWLLEHDAVLTDPNGRYVFQSAEHPSLLYYTQPDAKRCTCPGWMFKKRCAHIVRSKILQRASELAVLVIPAPMTDHTRALAKVNELF